MNNSLKHRGCAYYSLLLCAKCRALELRGCAYNSFSMQSAELRGYAYNSFSMQSAELWSSEDALITPFPCKAQNSEDALITPFPCKVQSSEDMLITHFPCKAQSSGAQELCESRGGHPGLSIPHRPYGFCGCQAIFEEEECKAFRSTVSTLSSNCVSERM